MRLVGYSSDDLMTGFKFQTKKEARLKRRKMEWVEYPKNGVIYHVYKVNGVLRYYLYEQSLLTLKKLHGKNTSKQGICYNIDGLSYTKKVKEVTHKVRGPKCCYCEVPLTIRDNKSPNAYTQDHIIPRHKGGNIKKPCCYGCNQEKGGLMLHSYIQLLNLQMADAKPGTPEYLKLQTKITNANKIAIALNKD